MITEIPTASEFDAAGLNQFYLAWQIAMQALEDYEQVDGLLDGDDQESASREYWTKSQPALANSFSLIQQGMEMALKGRIAAISPFLLISPDPKDWPKGVDTGAVPFSEFRTVDAADLIKVYNTFSAEPFSDDFRRFWEEVRRDRNKIMHSLASKSFDPATLIRTLLTAAQVLFGEIRWPRRLLDMEETGKYAAYGVDGAQNAVMRQVDLAIRHLKPVEKRKFFGFDGKRRSYLCPACYACADRDLQETWPKLAQFQSRSLGDRSLHCTVCDETVEVERGACTNPDCKGNVIYNNQCLTCVWSQDNPQAFRSGLLAQMSSTATNRYSFIFGRRDMKTFDIQDLSDDTAAKEHARLAMRAPHLVSWERVELHYQEPGERGWGPLLGTWVRRGDEIMWEGAIDTDARRRR